MTLSIILTLVKLLCWSECMTIIRIFWIPEGHVAINMHLYSKQSIELGTLQGDNVVNTYVLSLEV
jgi:hypothetical protein